MSSFNKPPKKEKGAPVLLSKDSPKLKSNSTNPALAAALSVAIGASTSLAGCSEKEKPVSQYGMERKAEQVSIKVFLKKHGLPESAVPAFIRNNKKVSAAKGLKIGKKYTLPVTRTTKPVSLDAAMAARKVSEKFRARLITYNTANGSDFGIFSHRGHILIPDYGTGFYYPHKKRKTYKLKPKKTTEKRNANKRAIRRWSKIKKAKRVAPPKEPDTKSHKSTSDKVSDSRLWVDRGESSEPKTSDASKEGAKGYTGLPYLKAKKKLEALEGKGPLKDYCFVIDAGHGYLPHHKDPGSVGKAVLADGSKRGIHEAPITYDVASRLMEKFAHSGAGVFMTRYSKDRGVKDDYNPSTLDMVMNFGMDPHGQNNSLIARKNITKKVVKEHAGKRKTIFVSVHVDSIADKRWRPMHIVIDNGGPKGKHDKTSYDLAKKIIKHLPDGYIKEQGLGALRHNPATGEILIELGNLANTKNANNMAHYKLREKYAQQIFDAFIKALAE